MSMLHHSPTRSRLRAIGHCMSPKLLRRMGSTNPTFSNLHSASHMKSSHPRMRNSRLYAPSAPLKSLASVGCSGRRLMFERRTPLCCSNELPEAGHGKREENDGETNRLWVVPRRSKFCRLSAQRSVRGCRRLRTNKQRGGIAPPTPSCGSTHLQRIIILKKTLGTVARSAVVTLAKLRPTKTVRAWTSPK